MDITLFKILAIIIAIDFFALGALIIFVINARINLKRKLNQKRFYIKVAETAKTASSSESAAKILDISPEEFITYCEEKRIEIPEKRIERIEKKKKTESEQQKRIMEEEAAWRAEQERIAAESKLLQEEEARKRQERLRKFGFR